MTQESGGGIRDVMQRAAGGSRFGGTLGGTLCLHDWPMRFRVGDTWSFCPIPQCRTADVDFTSRLSLFKRNSSARQDAPTSLNFANNIGCMYKGSLKMGHHHASLQQDGALARAVHALLQPPLLQNRQATCRFQLNSSHSCVSTIIRPNGPLQQPLFAPGVSCFLRFAHPTNRVPSTISNGRLGCREWQFSERLRAERRCDFLLASPLLLADHWPRK